MLISLFYTIDEFYKELQKQGYHKVALIGNKNSRVGRKRLMEPSEVITIMVYFHNSGYKNFKDYYCKYVLTQLRSEFPNLVSYNRFLELKGEFAFICSLFFRVFCIAKHQNVSFIDSFSIKVCHNKRIGSNKVFKKFAKRGKTSVGWFYGFKGHLVITPEGKIVNFYLTPGNVSDNNKKVLENLTNNVVGKIFGDKGYMLSLDNIEEFLSKKIQFITKIRSNMKNKLMDIIDKLLLQKRGLIESVINILKEILSIEHTRHRSPINFLSHIFSALIAYSFREKKPSIMHFSDKLTMSI